MTLRQLNCPRCQKPLDAPALADTIVTCPACGTRLIARSASKRAQGGQKEAGTPASSAPPVAARGGPAAVPASPPPSALADLTLPPPSPPPVAAAPAERRSATKTTPLLERLLAEVRALQASQQQALQAIEGLRQALASRTELPADEAADDAPGVTDSLFDDPGPSLAPIRATRRKSVLLVDDDADTRAAAVAELQRSDVPVRAFERCDAAISAIAAELPDVIAVELAIGGEMGGRDLVNLIKATMEWVHIPIVLWTREAIAGQREARQIHGADELVQKSAGAAALVARVITVFRRS